MWLTDRYRDRFRAVSLSKLLTTAAVAQLYEQGRLDLDAPLLYPPGTKYSYSTYGFNLLAAVVEGASGQEYLAYMRAKVFEPLGNGGHRAR